MDGANSDSKKSDRGTGASVVLAVINCAVWFFVGGFLYLFDFGGYGQLYAIFLGSHADLLLFVAGFICALAPLYLVFIKRKHIRFLTAYLIILVFIIGIAVFSATAKNYFKDFTKEKWLEYPQVRSLMLDDLTENHGIIGMDYDDVIELLGTPDGRNETVFTYYMATEKRNAMFIEVRFLDGNVEAVKYVNMI